MKRFLKRNWWFLLSMAAILFIGLVCQPIRITGSSMEPNFTDGMIRITKSARDIRRGDVVVLRLPGCPRYIKRIIGLPGEEVVISRGSIYINGKLLAEEYTTKPLKENETYCTKLGEDEYFVLGDNRPESTDSRVFGPVEQSCIIRCVSEK